jgi:hypothetical protein
MKRKPAIAVQPVSGFGKPLRFRVLCAGRVLTSYARRADAEEHARQLRQKQQHSGHGYKLGSRMPAKEPQA